MLAGSGESQQRLYLLGLVVASVHRAEKFSPRHDIGTRFEQKDGGLEVSVKRAQRLYNNRRWPNAVVLRLENVEFVEQ